MRSILSFVLLSSVSLLSGCCGWTYTNFMPSENSSLSQRSKMRTIVDSTANSCGFSPIRNPGEETHGYYKRNLDVSYDLGSSDEIMGIYLQVNSREKSVEFKRIEKILKLKLSRINPNIKITSGYLNPTM